MSYLISNNTTYGDTRKEEGALRRICVSHIPSNTNVRDILKFFGQDRVEGVTIVNKNPHNVFAFVQFKRPDGKTEALLMNETEFMGRKIAIRNYTDSKKPDNSKAREKYRQDFEAREAKPKLESLHRSLTQLNPSPQSSYRRNRSSSKGRSGSTGRRRDSSPVGHGGRSRSRSRHDSSIYQRLGSPVRSRLSGSPRQSHVSARDLDWDFLRRNNNDRSESSARNSNFKSHDQRSPTRSRRRSRSRSRSRSPAPSLSIASEIYRQAARNFIGSPPKTANPFSLGHPAPNADVILDRPSTAIQTWKPQTEQHQSGLAPGTFQVPTTGSVKVAAINGFAAVSTNAPSTKPTEGTPTTDQGNQVIEGAQPTMTTPGAKDLPPDVTRIMEMTLMDGTASNLSIFQINKVVQYFESTRLKLERPALAIQPVEPYVTAPPSVTSGDSAVDEDELALRVADKFSSINRKIHR